MDKQLNPQYIIQSLQIQLSDANYKIAERDALLASHYQRIQELEKELEELKEEKIKQLDKEAEEINVK